MSWGQSVNHIDPHPNSTNQLLRFHQPPISSQPEEAGLTFKSQFCLLSGFALPRVTLLVFANERLIGSLDPLVSNIYKAVAQEVAPVDW